MEDVDFSKFWTQDSSLKETVPMLQLFNEMYVEQAKVLGDNLELLDDLKEKNFDVMIFECFVSCAYRELTANQN